MMIKKNDEEILREQKYNLGEAGSLPLLRFYALERIPWIEHCFTTRDGGCSQGIFQSLNLSYTRGDDPACVTENYRRVAAAMGTTIDRVVTSDQTHTTNVRVVTGNDAGKGIVCDRDYSDVDGLITNVPNLLLATFYADCVPLYFVDTKNRAIGLSHSGWRGTRNRMGLHTVEAMNSAFGTEAKDLICGIGPSICQDCYEVSGDVAEEFAEEFAGFQDKILEKKSNNKYQLNLWRANELVLMQAGVPKSQIFTTNICTCCNSKKLFSHRGSAGKRGNLGAFLMIRSGEEE